MANQPGIPVEIDVFAHPAGAPEPYTIDWRFVGGPSQGNTPIDFPRNSGSHDMTFTLHDSSGKGLRFKGTPEEAMWVRPGQNCPTGKGNGANQVTFGSVSQPDRMVLKVNDDNSGNRRNLHYMLRFDPEGNDFDPEIRNGGGTTIVSTSAVTIGTAVVGASAALLANDAATPATIATWAVVGGVIGFVAMKFIGGGFVGTAPEM